MSQQLPAALRDGPIRRRAAAMAAAAPSVRTRLAQARKGPTARPTHHAEDKAPATPGKHTAQAAARGAKTPPTRGRPRAETAWATARTAAYRPTTVASGTPALASHKLAGTTRANRPS